MSTNFRIYPYGPSNSASDLNEKLDGLLIKREGSHYLYRPNHTVINWGSGVRPNVLAHAQVLNQPERVNDASSKLRTYQILKEAGIPTLTYTTSADQATAWANTGRVVGRDLDRGSQGRGCHVYQAREGIGRHAFYTKYWTKEREFRFHIVKNKQGQEQVIFTQEKKRKKDVGDYDKYIRSHNRGWCFAFKHLTDNPPEPSLAGIAMQAVGALGLDFGAVDLGWNSRSGGAVFEVNTAPGIEDSSLAAYVSAFQSLRM